MLLIDCPHCGPRPQTEFDYGTDATLTRPDPDRVATPVWLDYVYVRKNRCGENLEWWHHRGGCRRWIKVLRNNQTHEILATGAASSALERPA
jgi:sarcosine oxidase subunit delta